MKSNKPSFLKRLGFGLLILAVLSCSNKDNVERILCFGDSITAKPDGWVMTVNNSPFYETINCGRNGRRAVGCVSELAPYLEKHSDIDKIMIFLGVNDLPARDKRSADIKVALCVSGIEEAIDLALTRFKSKDIILVAPCGVNPATMSEINLKKGYQITQPILVQLESAFKILAEKKDIQFLSLLNVVSKENYLDGLHPNDAGNDQIAEAVINYLSALQVR